MKKKLSVWAKENGVGYRTAWNLVKAGKLPYSKLPSGTILIEEEKPEYEKEKLAILYARTSFSEDKIICENQAKRLEAYSIAKGYTVVDSVKEIGSGLNDKRKKLEKILLSDTWNILVVEHKDRLARFGTNYIIKLLEKQGKKVDIINVEDDMKKDLMQDLVSIITSFCSRIYGLRRSRRKTEEIIEGLNQSND